MGSSLAFWWVMRKDLRILLRDRTAVVFLFGMPLLFALIFGLIFSGGNKHKGHGIALRLRVVNNDDQGQGVALLAALKQTGMQVTFAPSVQQLREEVFTGKYPAGLVVPSQFTTMLEAWAQGAVVGQSVHSSPLLLYVDPAQTQLEPLVRASIQSAVGSVVSPLIKKAVLQRVPEGYQSFVQKMFSSSQGQSPVDLLVRDKGHSLFSPSAGDRAMPGLLIYFIFFMANSVAITLIQERQEGTLRRMRCAPIPPGQILGGKMLARVLVGAVQAATLMTLGYLFLKFSVMEALGGQVLILSLCLFAAVGLGLLIAALGRTQEQVQGLTTMALLVMGFLSGCLIPRELLPRFVQQLSYITPHAWALDAYNDLLLRHLPLTTALMPMAILAGFGLIFYVLAMMRFQYE